MYKMVLSHQSLKIWAEKCMVNYDVNQIGSCSIDLRIGNTLRKAKHTRYPMSRSTPIDILWSEPIEFKSFVVYPGDFILCSSAETFNFDLGHCARLDSKSTTGRLGLEHMHSGFVDAGFRGQLTFELLTVRWPFTLVAGESYLQLVVYKLDEPTQLDYKTNGHYVDQIGPTAHRG
jgi:dCTP deaminase